MTQSSTESTPQTESVRWYRSQLTKRLALILGCLALIFLAFWARLEARFFLGGTGEYLAWATKNYFGGISAFYFNAAKQLVDGGGYTNLAYPPGYALTLAAFQVVGLRDPQQWRVVQAFIDSLAVVPLVALSRWIGMPLWLAFIAAAAYAVFPPLASGSTFLLAESFSPSLLLWILVLMIYAVRKNSVGGYAMTGVAAGIATEIRPDFLFIGGWILLWFLWQGRLKNRQLVLTFLAAFLAPLIIWGAHNKKTTGSWVFTTTSGGTGLWEGLGEIPNDYGYILSDDRTVAALKSKGLRWHSIEADQYLKREYIKAWLNHPAFVLRVIGARFQNILLSNEPFFPDVFSGLQKAATFGFVLIPVAVILWWRNPAALLVVLLPILHALSSVGLVHFEPRYVRYVLISYLFGALLCVAAVWNRLGRSERRWLPVLRVVLASTVVAAAVTYSFNELAALRLDARDAEYQFQVFPRLLGAGAIQPKYRMETLAWQPSLGIQNQIAREGNRVRVITDKNMYAYQIVTSMKADTPEFCLARYEIAISKGGAYLMLLDELGYRLGSVNFEQPGLYQGDLFVRAKHNKAMSAVFANFSPEGRTSEFTVSTLDVYMFGDRLR